MDLELRCRCGGVTGTARDLRRGNTNRIVCHCDDCRAFISSLDRDDLIDAHGGVDIVQLRPAQLALAIDDDTLRCLRLSDKGMWRWHTACCNTPIGNTMGPSMPFIGMSAGIFADAGALDAAVGPAVGVQGKLATTKSPTAHDTVPPLMMVKLMRFLLGGLVRRAHKPSPVYREDGNERVTPRVLSATERDALR